VTPQPRNKKEWVGGGCNCCLYFMGNVLRGSNPRSSLPVSFSLSLKIKMREHDCVSPKNLYTVLPLFAHFLFFSLMIQSGICTFLSLWIFLIKIVCVGRSDYAGRKFLSSASPPTPETRDDLFNWGNRGLRTVFPYQGVGYPLTDGPGTIHRLASLLTAVIRYWCGTCRGPVFLFYFWFFHTDRYASVLLLTIAISRASRYIYSVSACGISCQFTMSDKMVYIKSLDERRRMSIGFSLFSFLCVCVCVWVGLPYHSTTDWRRR
jgi:hypothetical protein